MEDMQKKYQQAQLAIQLQGVVVLQNVMSCCRTCAMAEMEGVTEETLVAWTFAGQGNELIWQGDSPFFVPEDEDEDDPDDDEGEYAEPSYSWKESPSPEPADSVYWYHSGGAAAPAAAAKAFRDAGFEVDWDGSETKAVLVKFA